MSGQPTVCTCLPPFPKEGGTLYGLPVFHHEPGCPMPYEPEAAAPSPSVDEARGQLFDHFREWASGASVPDPDLSVDALVAAVRREEREQVEARVQGAVERVADAARNALAVDKAWGRIPPSMMEANGALRAALDALAAPGTPDSVGTEERVDA